MKLHGLFLTLVALLWRAATATTDDWSIILGRFLLRRSASTAPHRNLQERPECGEILITLDFLALRDLVDELVVSELGLSGLELVIFRAGVLASVDYGIQIRKICASCADHGPSDFACRPDDYAYDATHSGLLMIPLDRDGQIKSGTSHVNLVCHGTQSGNQDVPSNQWSTSNPEAQVLVAVILTSISGTFSIMPDYTGYGESTDFRRAYVVRRAYPTAVLPLYRHAEDLVATETNCASALADSLTTLGYSEGGYAAVAVADAMHNSGKTIISVQAGGGPFRLSSVQVNFLVQQILDGTFTSGRRYYVALLAATYSRTTTDVLNFGQGQDMLDATFRDEIVDVVHSPAGQSGINNLIPIENPLLILNQTLADTLVAALLRGEPEPCVTSAVDGESDILCEALRAQDLVNVLESTPYPVSLCHSVDDTLVSYGNLPDVTANSLLTLVSTEGSHQSAGVDCYLSSVLFFLDDANVQDVPVMDKTVPGGCPNPTASPTAAIDMTSVPTSMPESTPEPSWTPSGTPSSVPSAAPSVLPTLSPPDSPSTHPTVSPSMRPSDVPSLQPSLRPTPIASIVTTAVPSSVQPSTAPTTNSTSAEADVPSATPSTTSSPLSVADVEGSPAFAWHSQALPAMIVAMMVSLALILP